LSLLANFLHAVTLLGSFFNPHDKSMFFQNVGCFLNGLHSIISQKIVLLITITQSVKALAYI
jgi:hypothetical protein